MTPNLDHPDLAGDDAGVAGSYFDGRTSRRHRVVLTVAGGVAQLDGDVRRSAPLAELRVSERSVHAARKVTFADGAYLEPDDRAAFDRLLHGSGQRDGWVVRLQHSWRAVLAAMAGTVAVMVLGYVYALPAAAAWIASALPVQVERRLGNGMLEVLDGRVFDPSRLPEARRRRLDQAFARLRPPDGGAAGWRIVYRHSRIGPNAFALPSGDIVLTDEMVTLLADDDAVMGVLAHELGHLHHRHVTRRIIQGSAVAATAAMLFGDVSSVLATVPTLALDMKYSRDAEREADDYAVDMLRANGIALRHLVDGFAKFDKLGQGGVPYLSSHPPGAERIARMRARGGDAP